MRNGKLCFILLFLVLFYWPNPAQSHTDLVLTYKIDNIIDLVLEQRGDKADVFSPGIPATSKEFPVVAVLQGAGVDKRFYYEYGRQLAHYRFVVVISNHFQIPFLPPGAPPSPLPDEFPVAIVQSSFDGIFTPAEGQTTFDILDGGRTLFSNYDVLSI